MCLIGELRTVEERRMPEWNVRAGVTMPQTCIDGYTEHDEVSGLFGLSVQYAPGRSIEELAQAGQFPHGQISYATDVALEAALSSLGLPRAARQDAGIGLPSRLRGVI
jgi:hypothetical protein